jgi:hypothetical protein
MKVECFWLYSRKNGHLVFLTRAGCRWRQQRKAEIEREKRREREREKQKEQEHKADHFLAAITLRDRHLPVTQPLTMKFISRKPPYYQ